jgi:ubiquinone/menaquinone biosynthesis C-methylase UbiE
MEFAAVLKSDLISLPGKEGTVLRVDLPRGWIGDWHFVERPQRGRVTRDALILEEAVSLPAYAMNIASFPEMYERWLVGPLFRPWAEVVVDRARLAAGDRVLDIACGTGIVARLALKQVSAAGSVVGVDVSPPMLAVARGIAPAIDWREGNAIELPLEDGEEFDVVLCHQGLQFFPDKPAAVGQMRKALKAGGRLVIAVWKSLDETPFVRDLHQAAQRRLGTFVDRRHSFGDPLALERLITDGGFEDVRVESPSLTIRFADPAMFVHLNSNAVVGMSRGSSTIGDDERARLSSMVAEESASVVQQYSDADGLAFELGANVATARAK